MMHICISIYIINYFLMLTISKLYTHCDICEIVDSRHQVLLNSCHELGKPVYIIFKLWIGIGWNWNITSSHTHTHIYIYIYWLAVWNIFYFPIQLAIIIPTDELIFFRGVETTNQYISIYTYIYIYIYVYIYIDICKHTHTHTHVAAQIRMDPP